MSREVKSVFLTGAASGIGRHLALRLIDEGHRVFCTDIDHGGLLEWVEAEAPGGGYVATAKLDVRQPLDWKRALEEAWTSFGGVDVVMNIAGYLRPGYVETLTPAEVDMHLDVNVKGVMFGTQAAAVRMVEAGKGHIINMGSLASLSPVPGLSLYAASKFAVRGYTLSVAEELRPRGIAVSLVLLDAVQTPMLDLQAEYEEAALTFSGARPLSLEEVGDLFVKEVLPRRPLEVTLPKTRGLIARLAGAAPEITRIAGPVLRRRGLRAQKSYEKKG